MNQQRERNVTYSEDQDKHEIVHFYQSLSLLVHQSGDCESKQQELWYDSSDFHRFKQLARAIARECQQFGCVRLLDTAHQDTVQSLSNLHHWVRHGDSTRGCERLCNLAHGATRKKQKKQVIFQVLQAQDENRKLGMSKISSTLRIAEISATYSLQARQFSMKMGMADALAVVPIVDTKLHCRLRRTTGTRSRGQWLL